jgi:hypothetical protein
VKPFEYDLVSMLLYRVLHELFKALKGQATWAAAVSLHNLSIKFSLSDSLANGVVELLELVIVN